MDQKGDVKQVFEIQEKLLGDAVVISGFSSEDNRGSFFKNFEKDIYQSIGIDFNVNETFVSVSAKNVIRGMHFQLNNPQAKLVSVINGSVYDVIVDLRKDSSNYGKWVGVELSNRNNLSLYIPREFAHGFLSLEDKSTVLYQCDGRYDKVSDTGIRFDDPDVGIDWRIDDLSNVICSERDRGLMTFKKFEMLDEVFK
ncbi:MAG: dTDP-4-dehydrorhamnose 3,5-epimerase [Oscillospiraceae bacterium]|nr:dTDP-4-dehydrorhamnose 3,5-epimerase [Oscillospiraceae bacterium]